MEGAIRRCPALPSALTRPWAAPSCAATWPPAPSRRWRQQRAIRGLIFSVGSDPEHGVTRNQPNHWFLHGKPTTLSSPW